MTSDTVKRCSMCNAKDMILAPGKPTEIVSADGVVNTVPTETTFLMCPNCDHPRGRMTNNSYDGVGPKKNTV